MDKIKKICDTINERFKKSSFSTAIQNFYSESGGVAAYGSVSDADIKTLEAQGCECSDWKNVKVAPGFNPSAIKNVTFAGTN